jgi:predicted ArsR family transcriptional regulator
MTEIISVVGSRVAIHGSSRSSSNRIRSQIVEFLAHNGASRVSDIKSALGASKDIVRYHLTALETASIVRSNISPGTRARFTPFYSLTRVDDRRVGGSGAGSQLAQG